MKDATLVLRIALATVRRKWLSLLSFAVAIALFQVIVTASFPAVGGTTVVENVVSTFPPGLRQLLKIAPNLQAGFGLIDYLAFSWIHPVFLGLGAAFVVGRATDALAGEIDRGSIYLILSRPVPRWTLVLGKTLEMLFSIAVLMGVAWLSMFLAALFSLPVGLPLNRFLLIAIVAWALFSALGGGALLISSMSSRSLTSAAIGSAWTLVSFVLDVIPVVAVSRLGGLNPWHHYFPQEVILSGQIDWVGFVYLLLFMIITTGLATILFSRRDIS